MNTEKKNIMDILLETDVEKITEISKTTVEVSRLSKILGQKFELEVRALTSEELGIIEGKNIQEKSIIKAVTLQGKKLTDEAILNKFKIKDPLQIVGKLFNTGEIFNLYKLINELSGFSDKSIVEIKN